MHESKNSKKLPKSKRRPRGKNIGKKKLSCINGYLQLQVGDLPTFSKEVMDRFGMAYKGDMMRQIKGRYLSPLEIEEYERIFAQYNITENIWTDVD
jgi:hypothetical protein